MKRFISIFLAISILLTASVIAYANTEDEDTTINEVVAMWEAVYPDANVYVTPQGTVSIVISDLTNINNARTANLIYSPNGGSFRNFNIPSWWDASSGVPFAITFLPAEESTALLAYKVHTSLIQFILDHIDMERAALITLIAERFNVNLSTVGLAFAGIIGTYNAIQWIDENALSSILTNHTKVEIIRTMVHGIQSNIYLGWDTNYVSADPYDFMSPTFFPNDYGL